ncbi:MAG: HAD family phosphatase [Deltaproteobacteria bacterium]|nr:HAD family phosphatase [Deltaproteobacteria bacterium]HPW69033.1 HAD family phosphatase [Deltaproteobacteria bacterium]
MEECRFKAVLFDFGGVIADEGFRNGLHEIARLNGLDEEDFAATTREIIHDTGYITGRADEAFFWEILRRQTGIRGSDSHLRDIILKGFTLREWMLRVIEELRTRGIRLAILSDQTNWLDELEEKLGFFRLFERVFNSYHLGRTKLEKQIFLDVLDIMRLEPGDTLFVDDTQEHVGRAREAGIQVIHYRGKDDFLERLSVLCPGLVLDR